MNLQKETHINISDIKHHQLLRLWLIALAPKSPISLLPSTLAVAFHLVCWTLIILHLYLWIHYYWTIFSFLPGHVVRKKIREPTCLPLSGSTYNTFAKSPVPLARLSKLQSSNTSYNCGAIMCWRNLEQELLIILMKKLPLAQLYLSWALKVTKFQELWAELISWRCPEEPAYLQGMAETQDT